eukprot:TRINITY_DN47781_c0_g2_i1.p1 TRINITY_DN47781_c0_g2~~TRINITY_DN47781_c0_g2_i1.p1  ORF type:complete len:112 (-),score=12.67 TRINITY_DN47781_c0_g2_i1:10-345(-)
MPPRGRRPRDDNPDTKVSKALSWLLRHSGVVTRADGYIALDTVLERDEMKRVGGTSEVVERVVTNCAKQRFGVMEEKGVRMIRANQGHTTAEIGRAVQQECRDRSRMPSSA